MALETDRSALVEQIEIAFADGLSSKERARFLRGLALTGSQSLPYEAQDLEALFRNRVWQSVAFEERDQLRDLECVAELSDEALAYYLPALLILAVSDPSWLVNHDELEQRMIGAFGSVSAVRLEVVIAFVEFMIGYYSHVISQQDTLEYDEPMLDVEDFELRLLMYLDEKRAQSKRREELNSTARES